MSTDYILKSASDLGRVQLELLSTLLDAPTKGFLESVGIEPGMRCLDVGSGNGSIADWLADRAGPDGSVLAVDIVTDYLVEHLGVTVRRHDINDGVPDGGPFDLIHARLVLMHLSRREELLRLLVDALAPGGRLILGEAREYGTHPRDVLSAPSRADTALFNHVVDMTINVVGRDAGIHYEWVEELGDRMAAAGLVGLEASAYARTASGGTTGCLLTANYVRQVQSRVLSAGVTEAELARFYELSADPDFRAWSLPLVYTAGRKPPE